MVKLERKDRSQRVSKKVRDAKLHVLAPRRARIRYRMRSEIENVNSICLESRIISDMLKCLMISPVMKQR